jgi:hypothetical protein
VVHRAHRPPFGACVPSGHGMVGVASYGEDLVTLDSHDEPTHRQALATVAADRSSHELRNRAGATFSLTSTVRRRPRTGSTRSSRRIPGAPPAWRNGTGLPCHEPINYATITSAGLAGAGRPLAVTFARSSRVGSGTRRRGRGSCMPGSAWHCESAQVEGHGEPQGIVDRREGGEANRLVPAPIRSPPGLARQAEHMLSNRRSLDL